MAKFEIETTPEEQNKVLKALKQFEGQTVSVDAIATKADMRASRVRYVIVDLIEAKKVERVPTKAFNKHFVRYTYKIL